MSVAAGAQCASAVEPAPPRDCSTLAGWRGCELHAAAGPLSRRAAPSEVRAVTVAGEAVGTAQQRYGGAAGPPPSQPWRCATLSVLTTLFPPGLISACAAGFGLVLNKQEPDLTEVVTDPFVPRLYALLEVEEVKEGTPAAEAGVEPGDTLISIDGVNVRTSQVLESLDDVISGVRVKAALVPGDEPDVEWCFLRHDAASDASPQARRIAAMFHHRETVVTHMQAVWRGKRARNAYFAGLELYMTENEEYMKELIRNASPVGQSPLPDGYNEEELVSLFDQALEKERAAGNLQRVWRGKQVRQEYWQCLEREAQALEETIELEQEMIEMKAGTSAKYLMQNDATDAAGSPIALASASSGDAEFTDCLEDARASIQVTVSEVGPIGLSFISVAEGFLVSRYNPTGLAASCKEFREGYEHGSMFLRAVQVITHSNPWCCTSYVCLITMRSCLHCVLQGQSVDSLLLKEAVDLVKNSTRPLTLAFERMDGQSESFIASGQSEPAMDTTATSGQGNDGVVFAPMTAAGMHASSPTAPPVTSPPIAYSSVCCRCDGASSCRKRDAAERTSTADPAESPRAQDAIAHDCARSRCCLRYKNGQGSCKSGGTSLENEGRTSGGACGG